MSGISTTSVTSGQNSLAAGADEALRKLDMDHFLELMIAELQNQDPLNPMDNAQILNQISQIREVAATTELSETLEAVLLGQNLFNATALIGKEIRGVTDTGFEITGTVDRVTIENGVPRLHVGEDTVDMKNVKEILSRKE